MHDVYVSGIGLNTSIGSGRTGFWNALLQGISGVGPVTRFDTEWLPIHIAAEIKDTDAGSYLHPDERSGLGPANQVLLSCARQALEDAGLLATQGRAAHPEMELFVGTIHGELNEHIRQCKHIWNTADPDGGVRLARKIFTDNASFGFITKTARALGLTGRQTVNTNACAASGYALCQAAERIRQGECELALAGGMDVLAEADYVGFCSLRALAPERCQPFDLNRRGLIIGEGGCVLVLESWESLQRRGHTPLAKLCGYGWSNDAYHLSAPHPEGWGTLHSIQQAMQMAGTTPADIGCIVAHGTGTPWNDKTEAQVFRRAFAGHTLPVTAPKSSVGHCMGAASAVEATVGILSLIHQIIPQTLFHEQTDPECPIDVVHGKARQASLTHCLTNSAGFGGNNDSLIFSLPEAGQSHA